MDWEVLVILRWQRNPKGAAEFDLNLWKFEKDQDLRLRVGYEMFDKVLRMWTMPSLMLQLLSLDINALPLLFSYRSRICRLEKTTGLSTRTWKENGTWGLIFKEGKTWTPTVHIKEGRLHSIFDHFEELYYWFKKKLNFLFNQLLTNLKILVLLSIAFTLATSSNQHQLGLTVCVALKPTWFPCYVSPPLLCDKVVVNRKLHTTTRPKQINPRPN